MRKLTAILLLIVCLPIPSFAWGPEGHQVVGDIARAHLTNTARQRSHKLLLNEALGK